MSNQMTYTVSTDKSKLDIKQIHRYLSEESYWAKGRTMETVQTSIANSYCFGIYVNNKQVAFARVVTDYAIFAWLMDVCVFPEYQGNGYGKALINAITSDEKLQCIKRWGLCTDDAHGLYRQYGFLEVSKPEIMMERLNRKQNI